MVIYSKIILLLILAHKTRKQIMNFKKVIIKICINKIIFKSKIKFNKPKMTIRIVKTGNKYNIIKYRIKVTRLSVNKIIQKTNNVEAKTIYHNPTNRVKI